MKPQLIYYLSCLAFAMLLPTIRVQAQEGTNYILKETNLSSNGAQKIQGYQFFDDLGRKTLEATNGISNNGDFTYSLQEIQGEQLVTKKWLPVIGVSSIGPLNVLGVSALSSIQYEDDDAYDSFEYDALGRVKKEYKAGTEWKSQPVTVSYLTNASNSVKRYTVTLSDHNTLNDIGFYSTGTLSGVCHTNEDGMTVTTYTDVFGKKILERRGTNNDTYYVYDDFGRLTFVLMPEYQNNNNLDYYAFQYTYDLRGNLVMKKIPGCDPIEYLYDLNDRCLSIQDGELRKKGLYRFSLNDMMGRPVMQGLSSTKPNMKCQAFLYYEHNSEGIDSTDYNVLNGVLREHGQYPPPPEPLLFNCFNITLHSMELVNYYDSYSFLSGSSSDVFQNITQPESVNGMGMLTGSIILASNGEKLARLNAYDIKGNLVEVQEKGLNGNVVKTENGYTYTNKLESSNVTVNYPNRTSLEYDIWNNYSPKNDRLADATFEAMVGTEYADECEVTYTYDDLGRVASISRPVDNGKGNLYYEYDIHGWLNHISSNAFSEEIYYNDGAGTPLYSGNISSVVWKDTTPWNKGYKYTYDDLNRFVNAEYGESNFTSALGNFNEKMSYDGNGNVKTLVRRSWIQANTYAPIDSLEMWYDGNSLSMVNEYADPVAYSYSIDVKDCALYIAHNGNGSLLTDETRGITNIRYDDNNNPIRIQFNNGNVIKYIYSATGEKLRTIHYTAPANIHVDVECDYEDIEHNFLAVDSTDYLCGGSVIYLNAKPSKILFDGGYLDINVVKGKHTQRPRRTAGMTDEEYSALLQRWMQTLSRTELNYMFYTKDHLGNNRAVIDKSGTVRQKTDYYPSGTPFSTRAYTITSGFQPFKYNGKEFDMMHGLNTYDYGARQYYPLLARWDRVDPLCEKYYNVSPYAYCHNNPINRIDPDGMDDYYTRSGDYLGSNKAKTDNIYITDEGQYRQLEDGKYAINTSSRVALNDAELEANAYSKIFTNCFKLGGGDCSKLADGKIQVTVWQTEGGTNISCNHTENSGNEGGALASTALDHTNGAQITAYVFPKGKVERELLSTRSNIASTLKDHEFGGHYEKGFTHNNGIPDPTYKMQMESPIWNKTTQQFKEYQKGVIKEHGYGW